MIPKGERIVVVEVICDRKCLLHNEIRHRALGRKLKVLPAKLESLRWSPAGSRVLVRSGRSAWMGSAGSREGSEEMPPELYGELRRIAARHLRREALGGTLQPTALVHEAFLKVSSEHKQEWADLSHFLAVASNAMRRILVDHARRRKRLRRGGDRNRITLSSQLLADSGPGIDLCALDEVLERLARHDPRAARVVELRFFGGLTTGEAARSLGLEARTIQKEWKHAQAWLRRELSAAGAG